MCIRDRLQSELDEFREELSGKQSKFAALSAKTEATKSDVGRLKGDLDLNEKEQKDLQKTLKQETQNSTKLDKELRKLRKEEQTKFKQLKGLRDSRDKLHDILTELKSQHSTNQELKRSRKLL